MLGRDFLNAFCRRFVLADRLNSAFSCVYTSGRIEAETR